MYLNLRLFLAFVLVRPGLAHHRGPVPDLADHVTAWSMAVFLPTEVHAVLSALENFHDI